MAEQLHELVERLRDTKNRSGYNQTMLEAANAIESLTRSTGSEASLREALVKCRDVFARYANQHLGKAEYGTAEWSDRLTKSRANEEMMRLCDDALATPLKEMGD